jgi:hypothetical protein
LNWRSDSSSSDIPGQAAQESAAAEDVRKLLDETALAHTAASLDDVRSVSMAEV